MVKMPSNNDGLYKWEDSANLAHHCGTCAIPLHNPRALQTCFGMHVEPCYRFHQQLHFVQKSHECFGCRQADEMHYKRHGAIARLVKAIVNYDRENALSQPKFERRKIEASQEEEGSITSPDISSVVSNDYGFSTRQDLLTKKQKKALRRTEKMAKQIREDLDSVTKEEVDHISEAIHLKAHRGKGVSFADSEDDEDLPYGEGICPRLVNENLFFTAIQRRRYFGKAATEAAAAQRKDDVAVEETPIKSTDMPISSPSTTLSQKPSFAKCASRGTPLSSDDPIALVDPKIFERLGLQVNFGSDRGKKRRDLIKKLAALIKEDVDIDQKELEDSRIRQAAFWRFASADTLKNLVELHKGYCWATGELKNKEKYGESKVTKEDLTPDEEYAKMGDSYGAVKEVGAGDEPEAIVATEEKEYFCGVLGDKGLAITLKENVLEQVKDEKRHKRLSSQEGFTTPKSKTNAARSRSKSQFSLPVTSQSTPRAARVLRIIGTNEKDTLKPKPFNPVPLKRFIPKPQQSQQRKRGTMSGYFASLGDAEA